MVGHALTHAGHTVAHTLTVSSVLHDIALAIQHHALLALHHLLLGTLF